MIALRSGKTLVASALAACSLLAFSGAASAQLASCADILNNPPLAGNPAIVSPTSLQATTGGVAYCNVAFTYRDPALQGQGSPINGGPELFPGYAPGAFPTVDTYENIRMGFGFPLNTNTGSAAWGGRTVQTAGGGAQGSVSSFTTYIQQNPAAIGLSTDSGHGTADSGSGDSWGVVQGQRLNYGKIKDWGGGRAYCTAIVLAKQMARTYYGAAAYDAKQKYFYWEGFSGGGHMGHTQLVYCPEEYDGLDISSPARDWQQFRIQDSWAAMVNKKATQLGQAFTTAQLNSATAAAIAYCMTSPTAGFGGTVIDGQNILHDPRACDWKATMHVCGAPTAPAAPNCLDKPRQAELLQAIFDGPKNALGKLIYYPYSHGFLNIGTSTNTGGSTAQVMRYDHADNNIVANRLFMDAESIALGMAQNDPNAANGILYEDEMNLAAVATSDFVDASDYKLDRAKARGVKIILSHGTHDTAILFRKDPAYYREVATYFGPGGIATDFPSLQTWFRLYLMPGAPHTANTFLPNLYDWVEKGIPPEKLVRTGNLTGQARAVCPYPQYAQYTGPVGGSTTDPNNFTCGGNLETNFRAQCSSVKTRFKFEKTTIMNNAEVGVPAALCSKLGLN
jgi:hypothetical protein